MKKVLIANRGEIAVRIIRACRDLGLRTVAVYSKVDAYSLHVLYADEAICIGDSPPEHSYLKISNILSACEITGADAIHPGYGFLSENANFALICKSCGLTFIGPSSDTIALLGDKVRAKSSAARVKCPVIPGSDGALDTVEEALEEAERIGYPICIKAVAGGGGKGIRIASNREEFVRQFSAARAEAEISSGNSAVYLEKKIDSPRHIEVQILGDHYGNCIYLGERDCTVQRRRQKLIEEAPSPCITPSMRKRLGHASVELAKSVGYATVGTVEFLVDRDRNFYFMEVNTRIQVEHTVTEELTGIDLVREQIRVAMGEKLSYRQKNIALTGHVLQFRINAENPARGFAPSPGSLEYYITPGGPHVRIDSACYPGYQISPFYDSMIAKLIVKGRDRFDAMRISERALREFYIGGLNSTLPFHRFMLRHPTFLSGDYDIEFVDGLIEAGCDFRLD